MVNDPEPGLAAGASALLELHSSLSNEVEDFSAIRIDFNVCFSERQFLNYAVITAYFS